jgi:hypothetical protein
MEDSIGIKSELFENLNVFKYLPNQTHGPFSDSYNLDSDNGKKYTKVRGQRIFTISIPLNNAIEYHFPKLNKTIQYLPGTCLLYDNIASNSICYTDRDMEHIVKNTNDTESYVVNIYIREKNALGNTLLYIPDSVNNMVSLAPSVVTNNLQINSESVSNQPVITEEYIKTFNEVLTMFETNRITPSWRGHNSFTYTFKGQFEYFMKCVLEYIQTRITTTISNTNISVNALNMDHFNKKYMFDEFNPSIVDNAINPSTLLILQDYYKTTIKSGVFLLGDKQSNRFKAHNEPMSRILHYEMLPLIEHIAGKPLQPTYTYLSCYVDGSDLPPHTDRADCEYTVSFIINKPMDKKWPIYFHTKKQPTKHQGRVNFTPPKNECIECDCGPGGFMMFNGTDHVHFRESLEGEFYHIVLLHYRSI